MELIYRNAEWVALKRDGCFDSDVSWLRLSYIVRITELPADAVL